MGYFRHPKTLNEKKQWGALELAREEYRIRSRAARRDMLLLSTYDDISRSDQGYGGFGSWKQRKKRKQWMRNSWKKDHHARVPSEDLMSAVESVKTAGMDKIETFTTLPDGIEGPMAISVQSSQSAIALIQDLIQDFGNPKQIENHEGVALYYQGFKIDVEDTDFLVLFDGKCRDFDDLDSCVTFIKESLLKTDEE